jgi:hypothetical protein
VHIGPSLILAIISADFDDNLSAGEVKRIVATVEARAAVR